MRRYRQPGPSAGSNVLDLLNTDAVAPSMPAGFGSGRRVKTTTSLCPTCLARISADVFERDGEVWMDKECPDHGPFSSLLASDARHYYVADPNVSSVGSCCGSGSHCGDQTANHSCNMLIEIRVAAQ